MTDAETRGILRSLQNAYPSRYRDMAKSDAEETLRQWAALEPYDAVKAAVDRWIASERFHPTISDIRAGMETGQPTLEDFRRTLRFYLSMLQESGNQEKIDEVKARYQNILEQEGLS